VNSLIGTRFNISLHTVKIKMNRTLPRNPPKMVIISLDAKVFLYNCIEAVIRIIKVKDSRNDELVDTAKLIF